MVFYNYVQANNPVKLYRELNTSSVAGLISSITISGDNIDIETYDELSTSDETTLSSLIASHTTPDPTASVNKALENAMEFGHKLLLDFSTQNVLNGITQAGKTKEVLNYLINVKSAIDTGSLYVAVAEIDDLILAGVPVDLDPFINETILNTFKARIIAFLSR